MISLADLSIRAKTSDRRCQLSYNYKHQHVCSDCVQGSVSVALYVEPLALLYKCLPVYELTEHLPNSTLNNYFSTVSIVMLFTFALVYNVHQAYSSNKSIIFRNSIYYYLEL